MYNKALGGGVPKIRGLGWGNRANILKMSPPVGLTHHKVQGEQYHELKHI
jgi:hypothetical protein